MSGLKGAFDSFRLEEAYNWRDDIMEITRRIVRETDEARLNNIAEHFEIDLSEIREFIEMKRKKMQKPQTNADLIRAMPDEELAEKIVNTYGIGSVCPKNHTHLFCFLDNGCVKCWISWLKSPEVDNGT